MTDTTTTKTHRLMLGERNGHGAYAITRFSPEHGIPLAIGFTYKHWRTGKWVLVLGDSDARPAYVTRAAALQGARILVDGEMAR